MDFIDGWKAALRMAKLEPERFSKFNIDKDGNEIFNICERKGREMPVNLKELEKMLWMAFREGQQSAASSILSDIKSNDFTKYLQG